ncbi:MAG TPA: GAF and ANTAR domain-containing protein [Miltoncostaeaceae bacterium]|nr:GAF and ANTAR domain-containing protein [Miltoncostaeaceae bacterium]
MADRHDENTGGVLPLRIAPDVLSSSLRALRDADLGAQPVEDAVVAAVAGAQRVFAVTGAGLMLLDDESILRYAASTDPSAQSLEHAQEVAGQGPCVDAFVLDRPAVTADLMRDERWPRLAEALQEEDGERAVLGLPTHVGGITVGSLNVFADLRHEWDESELMALAAYNELLEGVLSTAVIAHRGEAIAQQLQHALDGRVAIERAIGVLMGRDGLSAVEAFGALRADARSRGHRVADVAVELLGEDA